MKKPKKENLAKIPTYKCGFKNYDIAVGYNQAIDDYETYHNAVLERLADEGEIKKILSGSVEIGTGISERLSAPTETLKRFAKAISKHIKEGL